MKKFIKDHPLFIILFLALILRLVYLFVLQPPLIWSDSAIYDKTALNLIKGNGYMMDPGIPFAGREPGYTLFFLVPIYFLFGHTVLAVQVFQIILSLLIIFLIYLLSKKYFSQKVAILAALFFTLYPPLIAYSSEILTEIPFTFLLIFSVFLILRSIEARSKKMCFAGGIILGAATLTRLVSVFLPFFLIPIFYFAFLNWRRTVQYFLLIFIAIAIFVIPWVLRNYLVFNTFIFGRLGAGEIYWSGSYIPWEGEWRGYIPPLTELEKGLNPIESDRKMFRLAIENIKENPSGVLKIWLKKPAKLFFKDEFKSVLERENKFAEFLSKRYLSPNFVKKILLGINILIVVLAFIGFPKAFFQNKFITILFFLIISYFLISYLPLNPDQRYKLPLMPYIMVLASIGFWSLYDFINRYEISKRT